MARWKPESRRSRFFRFVYRIPGSCWIWLGGTNGRYGRFYGGVDWGHGYAHRASYRIFCGHIPGDLFVCHACDTPLCVNPEHLFLGTPSDNVQDALAKGRLPTGEDAAHAKLRREDVSTIRELNPLTEAEIAETCERYGISRRSLPRLEPATAFGIALGLIFVLVTLCTGALVAFALSVVGGVR